MDFKIHEPNNSEKRTTKKNIIFYLLCIILISAIVITIVYGIIPNTKNKNDNKEKIEKKKLTIVDENNNQRPIAIMIDNNVGNSAHAGLQESYLNYEIIVEGGLTRIMAIFKDKDVSLIGPVRSSRHYFLDYDLESDCIYSHYGWSPYAESDIKTLNVKNINGLYDEEAFWRDKTIKAPHNVFTSIEKNYAYADKKEYSTKTKSWKLLNYTTESISLKDNNEKDEDNSSEILAANSINISYSKSQQRSYNYDGSRKVYLRFMNQNPHVDKTTKEQLYYKNIIIEQVTNSLLDNYGRQDLDTVGTGTGYYITNGYSKPINWTKSSRHAKTKYTYTNGTEIKVNDGNTFIQIVPNINDVTIG